MERRPFRLVADLGRPIPECCSTCHHSFPNTRCVACMSRAARVWDRAEATAALRTIREPIFRGALRAVLAMRWGIQSAGSLIVCRHGWHMTGPHEKLCVFCRTEIR